jgi:LssY C-terminus
MSRQERIPKRRIIQKRVIQRSIVQKWTIPVLSCTLGLSLVLGNSSTTVAQSTGAVQISPPTSVPAAPGQQPATETSYTIKVDASKQWVDTRIDVRGGAKLKFTATGTITYTGKTTKTFGPDGLERTYADLIHNYAVPNGGHGELIGRLGSGGVVEPFEIGNGTTYVAPVAERLFVGINQSMRDASTATGSFEVKIEVLEQGSISTVGGPAETAIPGITASLLASIPRRVSDQQHNPGDMVNVLLIGSEDEVVKTFTTGGWVHVDKSVESTVMEGLLDTLEKKDYLTMPMSTLYLFDRPQDYGFAHAEPVRVVMSRNHLRVWKSPYQVDGRPLWCVAATHDIGFERDQRNNGITHKIDPAIDGEREYVNQTLSGTGMVIARSHVTPADPLLTAKTATGGEFHSDGRILVLVLRNEVASR